MQLMKQILQNIDLSRFYVYSQLLQLTGRNNEASKSFSLNDADYFMFMPYVTLSDSSGKPLENGEHRQNEIKVEFQSAESGHNYFEDPITVQSLNKLFKTERYLGLFMRDSNRYVTKINSTNYPQKDINKYPIRADFHLIGYSLKDSPPKYSIENVYNRIDQKRAYTIEKSFNLSNNTNKASEKIVIGDDEFLVTDANVTIVDDQGRNVLLNSRLADTFTLKLKGSDDWVMFDEMNVRAFNNLWQAKQFKGIVLKERTDYLFTLNSELFPENISTLSFDAKTEQFNIGDTVTGGTSSATAVVAGIIDDGAEGSLILTDVSGTFQDNETVTGAISGSAATNGTTENGACLYELRGQLALQGYKLNGAE